MWNWNSAPIGVYSSSFLRDCEESSSQDSTVTHSLRIRRETPAIQPLHACIWSQTARPQHGSADLPWRRRGRIPRDDQAGREAPGGRPRVDGAHERRSRTIAGPCERRSTGCTCGRVPGSTPFPRPLVLGRTGNGVSITGFATLWKPGEQVDVLPTPGSWTRRSRTWRQVSRRHSASDRGMRWRLSRAALPR